MQCRHKTSIDDMDGVESSCPHHRQEISRRKILQNEGIPSVMLGDDTILNVNINYLLINTGI